MEEFAKDLQYGQPKAWVNLTEEEKQPFLDRAADIICERAPTASHLKPKRRHEVERKRKMLKQMFADQKYGDIYSVLGGVDIQVSLEQHFAEDWSEHQPYS